MGISGLEAWQHEDIRTTMIGDPFEVSGYTVTLESVNQEQGPNYTSTRATMRIERGATLSRCCTPKNGSTRCRQCRPPKRPFPMGSGAISML